MYVVCSVGRQNCAVINTPEIGVHSTYMYVKVMYRKSQKHIRSIAIAINSQSQQIEWMIMLI